MIRHFRFRAAFVGPGAARFAFLLVLAAFVPACAGAGPLPQTADSGRFESAPGKLIVPPRVPSPEATRDSNATALATVKRRAREAFVRGQVLENQHAYAAAIVSYTNAGRMDPSLLGPSYRIGMLYASRSQWDPAARAFREELHRNPGAIVPTIEYARVLTELGDTTRPVRMLEALTRSTPGNANVWRALGFVYGRLGRIDDAVHALRGAVGLDAKNALAWRDLGVVLAAHDDESGARESYRHALALDPSDGSALVNLGNLESRAGDHARALALYHDAEHRDSTQELAYRGQIRELIALGREGDAGAVWRRWLAVSPEDDEIREGAARHFWRQGRGDVALEIAREGVRRLPKSGQAWWLQGEMLAAADEHREALAAYRKSFQYSKLPEERSRAGASIAALRTGAPDSLRAFFKADSAAAAVADTTRRRER